MIKIPKLNSKLIYAEEYMKKTALLGESNRKVKFDKYYNIYMRTKKKRIKKKCQKKSLILALKKLLEKSINGTRVSVKVTY